MKNNKNNYSKIPNLRTDGSNQKNIERTVDALRDNVSKILDTFSSDPVNNGILLEDINLEINKNNLVAHKLNRKYVDFTVYSKDTGVNVWLSNAPNDRPDLFIILQASQSCTVSLRII